MNRWRVLLVGVVIAAVLPAATAVTATPAGAASTLLVPGQYPTIKAAIAAAATGDTVLVAPGTYRGGFSFRGKDITVSGTSRASSIIDLAVVEGLRMGPKGTLRGFTVTNGREAPGLVTQGVGSVIRDNLFVGNTYGTAPVISGNNSSPTIESNRFWDNTCDTQFHSGVITFANSSSPVVRNNEFVANDCPALNFSLPTDGAPHAINNTFVANRIAISFRGSSIDTSGQVYRNNVLWQNTVGYRREDPRPGTPMPQFDHNLVFDNETDFLDIPDPTGTDGNLSADPKFVDGFAVDHHPAPGSPLVDAGSPDGAPATDFDGVTRPADGDESGTAAVDIGAFERSSGALPEVFGEVISTPEGNTGSHNVTVAVRLSKPSTQSVSVDYLTLDDTATSGSGDFTDRFGILEFTPGQTVRTVSVPVRGDQLDEADEQLFVLGYFPEHATLGAYPTLRIVDDDAAPSFTAQSALTVEGNSGGHAMTFPVKLSASSGRTVTVSYSVVGQTARPDSDFLKKTGTVTFAPGQTQKSVSVWVKGDTKKEPKLETVTVRFTNPVGTWIPATSQRVVGTIVDDD